MNFAAIAPVGCLASPHLRRRPTQFCLAQNYMAGGPYRDFYRAQVALGHAVILDNGAYENGLLSFVDLDFCIQDLHPTIAVLPDVLGDSKTTEYLSTSFLRHQNIQSDRYQPHYMQVLHGSTIAELMKSYTAAPAQVTWFGLPRILEALRERFCRAAPRNGTHFHALGMLNGSLAELQILAGLGVESADSSSPVWRKICLSRDFDPRDKTPLPDEALAALKTIDLCLKSS